MGAGMTISAHPSRFLLHHTAEGRIGICADDDPNPPVGTQIIASLTFEEATALMDDMDETLADCLRRDGEAV